MAKKDRMDRVDLLTAQKVEVAIVFQKMLGTEDAAAYLAENGVSEEVALRVLATPGFTRASDAGFAGEAQRQDDEQEEDDDVLPDAPWEK